MIWQAPPPVLHLSEAEVHVWRVMLGDAPAIQGCDRALLSADELERAVRFRRDADRRRFVATRAALRRLLAQYLHADPASLRFQYNANGKPALAGPLAPHPLRFNLSHTQDIGLLALALGRDVGVDIERVRTDLPFSELERRICSEREALALGRLGPEARRRGFFTCWTRKEAVLKAWGTGLMIEPSAIEVMSPHDAAATLSIPGDPPASKRWMLCDLYPGDGFSAAVAAAGQDWQVRCWEFPV